MQSKHLHAWAGMAWLRKRTKREMMWRRWKWWRQGRQDLLAQDGLEASGGVGNDERVEVALRSCYGAGLVAMPRQLLCLFLQFRALRCD